MQLRKTEALRMLDHDDRRFRHVDADFDHGRCDQERCISAGEALHRFVLVGGFHLAVHETRTSAEKLLQMREAGFCGREIDFLGFLDQRTDPVGAGAAVDRAPHGFDHLVKAVERDRDRLDRLAACGLLAQLRHFHVAEVGQNQRARDRGRSHDENVGCNALVRERETLVNAEAVLFVHNCEREIAEDNIVLKDRVRPDEQLHAARRKIA